MDRCSCSDLGVDHVRGVDRVCPCIVEPTSIGARRGKGAPPQWARGPVYSLARFVQIMFVIAIRADHVRADHVRADVLTDVQIMFVACIAQILWLPLPRPASCQAEPAAFFLPASCQAEPKRHPRCVCSGLVRVLCCADHVHQPLDLGVRGVAQILWLPLQPFHHCTVTVD